MRRIRRSTLTLLVVNAALVAGLAVQHHRAARREADLEARLAAAVPPDSSWWTTEVRGLEGKFDTWSFSVSGYY